MNEKSIKGFPEYKVTKDGKIFHFNKEIKPYDNGKGYMQVKLYKDGKRTTKQVHRLVVGEPNGKDVDHIDNNKANNKSSNLQKLSHKDNIDKIYN